MQALAAQQILCKSVSQTRQGKAVRAPLVCRAQQSPRAIKAAVAGLPALLASHPALALVDDRLGGEGTGKILGVAGAEGWVLLVMGVAIWTVYYASTRELGGDANDDSGMSL